MNQFGKLFGLAVIIALTALQVRAGDIARIPIDNAEDLAPLVDNRWVIASSMLGGAQPRGGLYAIDARTGAAQKIYPLDQTNNSQMSDCPTQVAADVFAPHGIALQKNSHGNNRLYVVNHGGRESIEIFEIEQQSTPLLRWIGCVVAPAGVWGNAVALSADGTLFMTNMGKPLDGSAAVSAMGGNVITWTSTTGWRDVPDSAIVAPNGLLISDDGSRLYVASWSDSEIIELTRHTGATTRRIIKPGFHPDNLRWSKRGNIFAAGHRASVDAVIACFTSTTGCADPIPSTIIEIDPQSFTTRCARKVDLSMTTVAVNVGDEIWIGTARGDSVLRLPGNTLDAANCEKEI